MKKIFTELDEILIKHGKPIKAIPSIHNQVLKNKRALNTRFGLTTKNKYNVKIPLELVRKHFMKQPKDVYPIDNILQTISEYIEIELGDDIEYYDVYRNIIKLKSESSEKTIIASYIDKQIKFYYFAKSKGYQWETYLPAQSKMYYNVWETLKERINVHILDGTYEFYISSNIADFITSSYGSFKSCFRFGGDYENGSLVLAADDYTLEIYCKNKTSGLAKTGRFWLYVNPYKLESDNIIAQRGFGVLARKELKFAVFSALLEMYDIKYTVDYNGQLGQTKQNFSNMYPDTTDILCAFENYYEFYQKNVNASENLMTFDKGFCLECGEITNTYATGYCKTCRDKMISCSKCGNSHNVDDTKHIVYNGSNYRLCHRCATERVKNCADCQIEFYNDHYHQHCAKCRENYVQCINCGGAIKKDGAIKLDNFPNNTLYLCDKCKLDSDKCDNCTKPIPKGYRTVDLGSSGSKVRGLCRKCKEDGILDLKYRYCNDCGRYYKIKSTVEVAKGIHHCKDCINKHVDDYKPCSVCSKLVLKRSKDILRVKRMSQVIYIHHGCVDKLYQYKETMDAEGKTVAVKTLKVKCIK